MWSPKDPTALPSIQDVEDANIAIKDLEAELSLALLTPALTTDRKDILRREIWQRRSWLAPVRRLTIDVLSYIFEFCGEEDWRSPLRIAGVSAYWRAVVLATPRAWVFVDLKSGLNDEAIQCFFERSGKRPLHVFLSPAQPISLLTNIAQRLHCLSIDFLPQRSSGLVFHNLKRLSINRGSQIIPVSDLNIARFPVLRELICSAHIVGEDSSIGDSESTTVALLQSMSVVMIPDLTWLILLRRCRETLVSLRLHQCYKRYDFKSKEEDVLPKLKCLDIQYWVEVPDMWPLDLKTPVLESYVESSRCYLHDYPIHGDAGRVKHLHSNQPVRFSAFPNIQLLQHALQRPVRRNGGLSQLMDNQICQHLELIEQLRPYDTFTLRQVNQNRTRHIRVDSVQRWSRKLPGMINDNCGSNMPCNGLE